MHKSTLSHLSLCLSSLLVNVQSSPDKLAEKRVRSNHTKTKAATHTSTAAAHTAAATAAAAIHELYGLLRDRAFPRLPRSIETEVCTCNVRGVVWRECTEGMYGWAKGGTRGDT